MRNDSVLYRVLHVAHDAKCFSPCAYSHLHRQHSDNFIPSKMPTYWSYENKEEGSSTGLNRKQGLVETESLVTINFDMFLLSPEFTSRNIGCCFVFLHL